MSMSKEIILANYVKMNTSKGIIYLVQPATLIGTNRYKIGCSEQQDLKRILSYGKGTRYLVIEENNDIRSLEKKIKKIFKKKFKLIAGCEYFEVH